MKWRLRDKAKATIAAVAPGLATALGGPLAGAAAGALINALGGDEKGAEAALIAQNPETLLALRKAEQEFALRMRDLDIEPERLAAADRADARSMAKVNMKPQMVITTVCCPERNADANFLGVLDELCGSTSSMILAE